MQTLKLLQSVRTLYLYFAALLRISEGRIGINRYLFSLVCAAKVAKRREEIVDFSEKLGKSGC